MSENVQTIKEMEELFLNFEEMKNNKWDAANCGSKMLIFEEGLAVNYKAGENYGNNRVRAVSAIPAFNSEGLTKPKIALYYEVQMTRILFGGTTIGFCHQDFPMESNSSKIVLGKPKTDTIGLGNKNELYIDGSPTCFDEIGHGFHKDDIIGLGIVHRPNGKVECFATWNGILMGKAEVPAKLANLQLFPVVDLWDESRVAPPHPRGPPPTGIPALFGFHPRPYPRICHPRAPASPQEPPPRPRTPAGVNMHPILLDFSRKMGFDREMLTKFL